VPFQEYNGKLPREFYRRPTVDVALDLLGRRLVRVLSPVKQRDSAPSQVRAGRIVETEAYVGLDDLASHAARGRTPRTAVMFGPPGVAYVYLIYGLHYCLNAVTEEEGFPAAVLVRALEPEPNVAGRTNGPGRLCRALVIDRTFNGEDLCGGRLFVEAGERPPGEPRPRRPHTSGPRVGVAYAGEWAGRPWRFWLAGNPFVSRQHHQ
jgi:DNA-3-methyladenine glycosylase